MSDSELSDVESNATPLDAILQSSLRGEIRKLYQNPDRGEMTVNMYRTLSEQSLGLKQDFYLNHPRWKAESRKIIKAEVDRQETTTSSQTWPQRVSPARTQSSARPEKRPAPGEGGVQRKKRKTVSPLPAEKEVLSSTLSELSSSEETSRPKVARVKARVKASGKSPKPEKASAKKDSAKSTKPKKTERTIGKKAPSKDHKEPAEDVDFEKNLPEPVVKSAENSDSDLSSLVDEEPKTKRRRKSKDTSEKTSINHVKQKARTETADDPDTAEIRRLQGWLVKCGIRKLWGKELKPYDSPNAKIQYLKSMIRNAGMTGRYSMEKATQIKEARELAADIEAVQEGAERWGRQNSGDESNSEGRPKRRLVRGAKNYDFLSSDGEETD